MLYCWKISYISTKPSTSPSFTDYLISARKARILSTYQSPHVETLTINHLPVTHLSLPTIPTGPLSISPKDCSENECVHAASVWNEFFANFHVTSQVEKTACNSFFQVHTECKQCERTVTRDAKCDMLQNDGSATCLSNTSSAHMLGLCLLLVMFRHVTSNQVNTSKRLVGLILDIYHIE